MDNLRFSQARTEVMGAEHERKGIGTLSEKTLHAVLKRYLEPHSENHEVRVGNYVADIIGENGIIEIQTGSFTPLRPKLECLLDFTDVTVVYPMAAVKRLSWIDPETGEATTPRKSPKKAKPCDAFNELIRIKYTLDNPRFHLKLIMLDLTEYRYKNGRSADGKKGSERCDRIPHSIIEELDFHTPRDFDYFIPNGLSEQFTIKDFAKCAGTTYSIAQKAISILCYLERIKLYGKNGRINLYTKITE